MAQAGEALAGEAHHRLRRDDQEVRQAHLLAEARVPQALLPRSSPLGLAWTGFFARIPI